MTKEADAKEKKAKGGKKDDDTSPKGNKREDRAQARMLEQQEKLKNMDIMAMGRSQLTTDADDAMNKMKGRAKHANQAGKMGAKEEAQNEDPGLLISFIQWFFRREKKPALPWTISRREEIDSYITARSFGLYRIITLMAGEGFWYNAIKRKRMQYVGERDPNTNEREKRGICWWPDPPNGGGESYYGLWRADQPHESGLFRWFDGDKYLGAWKDGKLQGYGVYMYSGIGPHPNDRYEGAYHEGVRQGTGVYKYGNDGGVYMGEWMQGKMNGKGFLLYSDGEHYVGDWKLDLKHGTGIYVWGRSSVDNAGDKYEGQFQDGNASGVGRTTFEDGYSVCMFTHTKHEPRTEILGYKKTLKRKEKEQASAHSECEMVGFVHRGWHKGRYFKGKMHGWGIMRTADGYEYVGQWKDDEMNGEFMNSFVYGMKEDKVVQQYKMGELVGTRKCDPATDWSNLEAPGKDAGKDGDAAGDEARNYVPQVTDMARRAIMSQTMARNNAKEAQYWTKTAMTYREYKLAWWGMKQYFVYGDGF